MDRYVGKIDRLVDQTNRYNFNYLSVVIEVKGKLRCHAKRPEKERYKRQGKRS